MKLSELAHGRDNNFNLLRFIAAALVIFDHDYLFSHNWIHFMNHFSLGATAVNVFFIISGFLVCRSFLNAKSPGIYFLARFLRIWPALVFNAIFLSFVFGPIMATHINASYFHAAFNYVYMNLILHTPGIYSLPNVFEGLKHPSINAVLWTLSYEVTMYCLLALLGILGLLRSKKIILFILILLLLIIFSFSLSPKAILIAALLRFLTVFFLGVALSLFREYIPISYCGLIISLILFIALSFLYKYGYEVYIFSDIVLAYFVISFAYLPKGFLLKFNKLGDYSYGLYIYGWPMGRALSYIKLNFVLLYVITLGLTLCCAALSWHLLEKRALSLKETVQNKLVLNDKNSKKLSVFFFMITICLLFIFVMPIVNQPRWFYLINKRIDLIKM